jgi:flagellar hook-associated protein 1 FlgK
VPAPNDDGPQHWPARTDRLNFTGVTHIGIVDAEGNVVRNFRVDFNTRQILDDQANVTSFANSVGDFQTALNTAMGADGQVSFANGQLQLEAMAPGTGLAIRDDASSPAMRAGKGFSHMFGLNDLVTHGNALGYATGLSGSDLHGFTDGDHDLRCAQHDGSIMRTFDFHRRRRRHDG